MLDKLKIIGYSGHSFVVIEAALLSNKEILGYFDILEKLNNPYNLTYLGDESSVDLDKTKDAKYIVGIGDNQIRQRIISSLGERVNYCNIVHPNSHISSTIEIGEGNFVNTNAIINALTKIGNHSIINTGCIIEHECQIADFVHIAPGAVLCGNVKVGDGSFIGANSVIKQGVEIGKNVIIGAGSVVIKDVLDNNVVAGNPSKTL